MKIKLVVLFLMVSHSLNAQENATATRTDVMPDKRTIDSIRSAKMDEAALLYPRIRQFSIQHQQTLAGNITSKLYGKDFFKGRIGVARTTINMNVPVINDRNNTLIASIGVVHQFFAINNVSNLSVKPVSDMTAYMPMINTGVTYSHRDTLFSHAVTFTGVANALTSPDYKSRQFTFMAMISVPLIQKKNTFFSAGAVFMYDPSSPAPAFLYASLMQKFPELGLDLMIDLPYRIALRKAIKRTSITAYSELFGANSFFEFKNADPDLPLRMTYSTLEIKSGVLLEYQVTRKMIFSLSGGLNATLKSRILEQGAKPNDYFIKNTNGPAPFVQAGISLLPFWSPFKKSK